MRIEERLTRLESRGTPTQAVLHWLEQAQQFPNLTAYARSLDHDPSADAPINRILRIVRRAVRGAMKGRWRADLADALQLHSEDAVFRFQLVLALNEHAMDYSTQHLMLLALHIEEVGDAVGDPLVLDRGLRQVFPDAGRAFHERWLGWHSRARELIDDVHVEEAALRQLQASYFNGREVLFVDPRAAFADVRKLADTLAELTDALPGAIYIHPRRPPNLEPQTDQDPAVRGRARVLADEGRLAAFGWLHDGKAQAALARRALES